MYLTNELPTRVRGAGDLRMRDGHAVHVPGKTVAVGGVTGFERPTPLAVKPSAYLLGSFLYLAGSCCFFAGGFSAAHGVNLYHGGNALFVVGSVLFVYDGYCASRKEAQL